MQGARVRVIAKGKPKLLERSAQLIYPIEIRVESGSSQEETKPDSIRLDPLTIRSLDRGEGGRGR